MFDSKNYCSVIFNWFDQSSFGVLYFKTYTVNSPMNRLKVNLFSTIYPALHNVLYLSSITQYHEAGVTRFKLLTGSYKNEG